MLTTKDPSDGITVTTDSDDPEVILTAFTKLVAKHKDEEIVIDDKVSGTMT